MGVAVVARHAWRTRTVASGGHRLSGVSSFGFGGTNAHVVLDAPPPAIEPPRAPDAQFDGRSITCIARRTASLAAKYARSSSATAGYSRRNSSRSTCSPRSIRSM
ncbi:MAG: hypothetical protein FJ276_29425 [Planctomycetes bacterium]|nr:hypothetical protein [Planctomycetota bacterium]